MSRCLRLEDVRPTQLYLSKEKLVAVLEWFDVDDPNYDSLPVFEHEGAWYFSDGHTRAFVAALAGADTIRIHRDERVREECDLEVYRTCIDWCADEGIETIHDLSGRVVEPETYEVCWIERCQRLGD
ncbi:histone acetyltransferase [Natronosalvus vescus]|uniref:histone acetyltransferase n=1 Tax=Natronosalvus vescus TaxID=2953881 RepID=UPI0020903E2E|nr:histone acetyltransferase [Natronosalvus vescus]